MIRYYTILAFFALNFTPILAQEDASSTTPKIEEEIEVLPVTGRRLKKKEADEISKIEISREEAELVAPSGDVAQVPKLLPGTLTRPQQSQVAIRGSDQEESLYLIDNLEAPNLFEPISGTSIVPTRAISQLEFYPGNFDAQYGNSTGGVIRLQTRGVDILEPYSEFRVNLPIYVSAYHERPLGDASSLIASARKSTLEPFARSFIQREGLFILPFFQDAYVQHSFDSSAMSIKTRFVHSRSGAELQVYNDRAQKVDGTSEFDFLTGYNLLGVDIQSEVGEWGLRFDPYISDNETQFNANKTFFQIDFTSLIVPLRLQRRLASNTNLFLGAETRYTDFSLSAEVPDTVGQGPFPDPENSKRVRLNADSYLRLDSTWASLELGLGDVVITPSFRVFRQSNIKKSEIDPRLVARWNVSYDHILKLGAGRYSASPLPQQLDEDFGNPELTWVRSTHYTLGWLTYFGPYWSSNVELFLKDWSAIPYEDSILRFVSETTRKAEGLEWFLRYTGDSRWFGWLAYTFSKSREKRANLEGEIPADNDSTHVLNAVGNLKLNERWQIGSRLKHQTGFVYTPIGDVFYQTNTDTYQPSFDPALINSKRVPNTTSFSLFAQYEKPFKTWQLTTRFGFEEYQFEKSSPNIQYNYNYTKKEFASGLPVIPFVELRAIL